MISLVFSLFCNGTLALIVVAVTYGIIHPYLMLRRCRYWNYKRDIGYLFKLAGLHLLFVGIVVFILCLIGGIPALIASFIMPKAAILIALISILFVFVVFFRYMTLNKINIKFPKPLNKIIEIGFLFNMGLMLIGALSLLTVIMYLNLTLGIIMSILLGIGLLYVSRFELPEDNFRKPHYTSTSINKSKVKKVKNVLFLMIDDVRRRNMSLYGYLYKTTPFLDSIQDKLLIFENCIANGTRSGHNIPTLLTGVYSPVHNYGANFNLLFLPQIFEKFGYYTACISGNPHITKKRYSHIFNWFYYVHYGKKYLFLVQRLFAKIKDILNISYLPAHFYRADGMHLNELAQEFIKSLNGKHFFVYISYIDVHDPYLREKKYIHNFAISNNINISFDWKDIKRLNHGSVTRYCELYDGKYITKKLSKKQQDILVLGYDETIYYSDKIIKNWFQFLEREKLIKDTVVIITADHGEMLGEKGIWTHIDYPYNPLFEVPLCIYHPEVPGKRIKRIIGSIDIPSLVLDAAGIAIPADFDRQLMGEKLKIDQVLKENDVSKGYAYIRYGDADDEKLRDINDRLLIKGKFKLREYNGELSYYDYEDEFLEHPISINNGEAEEMIKLQNKIEKEISLRNRKSKKLIFEAWHIDRKKGGFKSSKLDSDDEKILKQLKSLGYL